MSKSNEELNLSLIRLQSKSEELFARMSKLFHLTKNISSFESRVNESFMAESEIIDEMQTKFEDLVDTINQISLALDPKANIDYQSLTAFDELYSKVKRVRNNITNAQVSKSQSNSIVSNSKCVIKLPPIELPKFDGKTENWPKFYESFKANIHDNDQLTDSQRVQYLVSKLTDSALKITAGIVPSGGTYNIIWDSLVKKHQDKRALGTHYLNNIFNLKNCVYTVTSLESFIEKYSASILALKQLNITDLCDFILFNCALRKLESQTVMAFELSVREVEIPSYRDLISFVQHQVKILERSNSDLYAAPRGNVVNKLLPSTSHPRASKSFVASNDTSSSRVLSCVFCNAKDHSPLFECAQFKESSAQSRFDFVKIKHGCVNCLSLLHTVSHCNSTSVCEFCDKRHHTLLHFNENTKRKNVKVTNTHIHTSDILTDDESKDISNVSAGTSWTSSASAAVVSNTSTDVSNTPITVSTHPSVLSPYYNNHPTLSLSAEVRPTSTVLLSTAQVYAKSKDGITRVIRCLIDNGSQNNLITVDCCKILNLPIIPLSNYFVKGVGSSSRPILGYVHLDIESRVHPNNKYYIHALVVDGITDRLPSFFIEKCDMSHLEGLTLADLTWNIPGSIDLVLGAQLFPYIYLGHRVDSSTQAPPALSTAFGYVLMGDYPNISQSSHNSTSFSALVLDDMVQKFWQLEELPQLQFLSPAETECENLFASSLTQEMNGRYSVALPFTGDPKELGNSRTTAQRRFMALERKLKNVPESRDSYHKVIKEYIKKDYLSEVPESDIKEDGYYIPHHAVIRPDKPMPRVVLDASAKTHTGISLNDVLHKGPNLQANLFLLLLDFRLFPVAMTADIKQMYLQIGVNPVHRKYLRMLFRIENNDILRTFQFNRVPFGLKSSPYLAMRIVRQLAVDLRSRFPEAAGVAESRLYMDDLVHSVLNEEAAIKLSMELIQLFRSGCFDLVKWTSNSSSVLGNLPDSHRSSVNFSDESSSLKVLGLSWEPSTDMFFFTTSYVEEKCTKRNILSVVARFFDVLGLVAPVVMYAKMLIKELWLCNIGWDDTPPVSIIQRFSVLLQEFPLLETLKIPRHVGVLQDSTVLIVAFCDASMNGYGAVIYIHSTDVVNNVTVRLLCAKSKVSPAKVITLARLELCAALLMSKLVKTVRDTLRTRIVIQRIYAFSDSTIALSWIRSSPHRWSVFVSNRVAQCQENLSSDHFYHIRGVENPSDCLSRGLIPSQLISDELWVNGPAWMQNPPSDWPTKSFDPVDYGQLPEHKSTALTVTVQLGQPKPILCELAERISDWDKLLKIIVYVLRFIRRITCLSAMVNNIMTAEKEMIRAVQSEHFASDIAQLKKNKALSKRMHRLAVFLDEDGILRIGGRLSRSDLLYEAKHPMLLPKHDHIVELLIRRYHVIHCHAGPGLLMSIIRQRFWILDARTVIRSSVHKCNSCFRVNPSHPTPKMADLPACRIMEAKAFVHTGVDYAGPLRITLVRRRGQHCQKAYICLFVCLVTKAIHVELVSALTSDAFLAAFKRFISRRGPVSCLYSDNGTNFIGAKAQLDELYNFLINSNYQPTLKNELLCRRIDWKFIPPRAPHFGGMWESNIKSLKTHLYRVIGDQLLTYEELQTVLVQIECLMNSRPLNVVSSDPDPEVITPAHFLMSTPLQYLPASDLTGIRISLSCRKQLLDSMVQSFWKKWRLEYLHTLQVRQKWATPDNPVKIGTVVLVGQEESPPLHWPLGVIVEIHPGTDNIIRVVTVRTKQGLFKRPVVKLYPIPTQ